MTEEVRNIFPAPEGEDEKVVVIPRNYVEEGVVPICIRSIDDDGRPVCRDWIEAVRPVAGKLRCLARKIIQDEWRVSELAEGSVHMLSRRYGARLPSFPSDRIY